MTDRRTEYQRLRDVGYTYQEIGNLHGISRQAVWSAMHPGVSADRAAELEQMRERWRAERMAQADTLEP